MTAPELPEPGMELLKRVDAALDVGVQMPGLTPEGEAYYQRDRERSRTLKHKVPHEGELAKPVPYFVVRSDWSFRPESPRPRSWWRNLVNAHRSAEDKADRDANLRASMDEMHALGVRDGWAMRCSMPERSALLGHLVCALSGAAVGALFVLWWVA